MKGGGIRCSDSSPVIANNIIIENNAQLLGGGIYWRQSSSPYIVNNTVMHNTAGKYGGGVFGSNYIPPDKRGVISNSIFWANTAPSGTQIALYLPETKVIIGASTVQYGKDGVLLLTDNISLEYLPDNISGDPLIEDIDRGNLLSSSPCIDKGDNRYIASINIMTDYSGNNRIADGNSDGEPVVDMGASEFGASFSG